jgi:predicted RNase H-like nuclease
MERRQLLATAGIELPDTLEAGLAAADDVLDAAVVAWSAARKARREAATLPPDPPIHDGRPVAIWYEPSVERKVMASTLDRPL